MNIWRQKNIRLCRNSLHFILFVTLVHFVYIRFNHYHFAHFAHRIAVNGKSFRLGSDIQLYIVHVLLLYRRNVAKDGYITHTELYIGRVNRQGLGRMATLLRKMKKGTILSGDIYNVHGQPAEWAGQRNTIESSAERKREKPVSVAKPFVCAQTLSIVTMGEANANDGYTMGFVTNQKSFRILEEIEWVKWYKDICLGKSIRNWEMV